MNKIFWMTIFFIFTTRPMAQEVKPFVMNGGSNDVNAFVDQFNEMKKRNPNVDWDLRSSETLPKIESCAGCPQFLNLGNHVNKILAKIANDPKYNDDDLPNEVKKLKMIYYVTYQRDFEGNVRCHLRDNGNKLFDRDATMNGQAKLIYSQAFSYHSVDSVLLNNPENDRTVYYFRDPDQKDVLVQVVSEKGKPPVINYYSYQQTADEENPYHLPSLGTDEPKRRRPKLSDQVNPPVGTNISAPADAASNNLVPSKNRMNFNYDPKLEKRGILPRDYRLGDASLQRELAEGVLLTGETNLSIAKGSDAKIKLTSDNKDVVIVGLQTKLNGKSEHKIIVPYRIELGESVLPNAAITGSLQTENNANTVAVSLTDHNLEVVRAVVRDNRENGKTTLIIARDFNLESRGVVSVSAGKDEADTSFVALRHAMNLNKTTSMALDIKYDNVHHSTLYYTLSSKF